MKIMLFLSLLIAFSPVFAQDASCPALVDDAVALTGTACEGIGRNQICYGHTSVTLEARDANASLAFNAPGDLASVLDVRTIRLLSMNDLFSEWGVALMKLQANLPDTLPGENVTFVLFGDVEITDAAATNLEPITLTITATNTINVRGGPSTGDAVVASLTSGQQVTADGRNTLGDWLRVQLEDGAVGWVSASLVTVDGDPSLLDAVDAAPAIPTPVADQPPLRAFYLGTGTNDSRCTESPASGLLIQTPQGAGAITFNVNGVDIRLMSTAYFQAQAGGDMVVSVVEGQVQAQVNGAAPDGSNAVVWIPPGAQVHIPLNANGVASGPPGAVVPYGDQTALSSAAELLPLSLDVPAEIAEDTLADYLNSPLISDEHGNGCLPDGRVIPILFPNGKPGDTHHITGLPAGTWHAKAGTTVTFTVTGDLSLEGDRSTTPLAYVYFFPTNGRPLQSLAQSAGEEKTVTYTFLQDTDFYLSASVYGSGAELINVTFTITCDEQPESAAPPVIAAPGG